MKRTIIFILCAAAMALSGHAYVTVDGIYYNIVNGEAQVTHGENAYSGDVVIPESVVVEDVPYPVTGIGKRAFKNCKLLKNVSLPNSIVNIQDYAFYYCTALTRIKIPDKVTSIGEYAFEECSGIVSVDIPKSVSSIGARAFYNCEELIELSLDPNPNLTIGVDAFRLCRSLLYVKIPDIASWCGITFEPDNTVEPSFPKGRFYSNPCTGGTWEQGASLYVGTKKITSVEIPGSVTAIKDGAFVGCEFTSVTLPSSVTSIGDCAFGNCRYLEDINVPNSVTSIGEGAFVYTRLTSIDFWPGTATDIRNYTFYSCDNLNILNIQEGVTSVGDEAFSYCTGVTELTVPKTLISFGLNVFKSCKKLSKVTWNAKYCNNFNRGHFLFNETFYENSAGGHLDSFTFGDEVVKIPAYLCYCITIPSLQIPNSAKTIGKYAFYYSKPKELKLGNSIETIESYAFTNSKIEKVAIPNSVTTIGEGAFQGCSEIKELKLGKALEQIGPYAFYDCKGLTSIDLPSQLTTVGNFAFSGCTKIESIGFPNSLTSIGDYAFNGTRLESIIIPNSVINIGDGAFSSSWNSSSIVIGNSVETIGRHAFNKCNLITHITIPASVKSIKGNAFPETLTKVVWNAKNCEYVEAGGDQGLFSNCTLTSIAFGNGVERIPNRICYNQSELTEITLPSSVNTIGTNPLQGCTGLKKITSHIMEPMTVVLGLTKDQYEQLPLYIPKGTTDAYRNAFGWADIINLIEFGGIGDVNGDDSIDDDDVTLMLEMVLDGNITDAQFVEADVNADGSVDGCDVSITMEKSLAGE